MTTIQQMFFIKFAMIFALGVGLAVQNTDWSTPELLFIDPKLTKFAVGCSVVGIFGGMITWMMGENNV